MRRTNERAGILDTIWIVVVVSVVIALVAFSDRFSRAWVTREIRSENSTDGHEMETKLSDCQLYGNCEIWSVKGASHEGFSLSCQGDPAAPGDENPTVLAGNIKRDGSEAVSAFLTLTTGKKQAYSGKDIQVSYRFGDDEFSHAGHWEWDATSNKAFCGTLDRQAFTAFLGGIRMGKRLEFTVGDDSGVIEFDREHSRSAVDDFVRRSYILQGIDIDAWARRRMNMDP